MAEVRNRTETRDEREDVVEWRRRQLRAAGFGEELAGLLACTWQIDLHRLLELVEHGCPPILAARIMAPLEPGWEALL